MSDANKAAFDLWDTKKVGSISRESLERVTRTLGESFSTEELDDMLRIVSIENSRFLSKFVYQVDQSGNGSITYQEFAQVQALSCCFIRITIYDQFCTC
jgi:Ca2+-binding EF-hand superfamily protein